MISGVKMSYKLFRSAQDELRLSLAIMIISIIGFYIRFHNLGIASLWLDESYSFWFSSRDWSYLWNEVPKFETHPSLYYSLLKMGRAVLGDGEFALRLPSTLINVVTIPAVAMIARVCGGHRMGFTAAVLAAVLFACSETQLTATRDHMP